jgi:methylamine dehydrogenase light chain
MDDLVERLARKLAAHTSRRRLLGMLGTALVGSVALPLLPVHRIMRAAEAADPANEPGDQMSCDYWRYCGFDGNLCGCCGGTLTDCPPGSILSPTGWVGTCRHPVDGKDYIIAYRDCCGKEYCGRCACHGDKGDLPIYRTQLDNEVLWCFGVKSGWAVNCTTAVNLGVKS